MVMMPPQPQAKAKGISWREAGILAEEQIPKATGSRQAAVPVLDNTEESRVPTIISPNIRVFSVLPHIFTTF